MKAYLIDPEKQEVTEVEYSGDYKDIYKLIDCSTFEIVGITPKGDGIYVDEEDYMQRRNICGLSRVFYLRIICST